MRLAGVIAAVLVSIAGCLDATSSTEDHPLWGRLADSPASAAWFVLDLGDSSGASYSVFQVPIRKEQVYREGDQAALILEVGFWDPDDTLEQFALVANPTESTEPWSSIIRSKSTTTFTNDSLTAPVVIDSHLSTEPFYIELLNPERLDSVQLVVGERAGRAPVLLSILAVNPQEPVPAASAQDLLTHFQARGPGHVLEPIATGQGFKVIDYEQWTLSGPFGKEQGVRSNGEVAVNKPPADVLGQGAPLGPFEVTMEVGAWAGQFHFRYGVQPALGSFEERGHLFGQDVSQGGTLSPMDTGTDTLGQSLTVGTTDWSFQVTRAGAPDVETLVVNAALFGGQITAD